MGKFKRVETGIRDLVIIEPTMFGDHRGFFMEAYSKKDWIGNRIIQDRRTLQKYKNRS